MNLIEEEIRLRDLLNSTTPVPTEDRAVMERDSELLGKLYTKSGCREQVCSQVRARSQAVTSYFLQQKLPSFSLIKMLSTLPEVRDEEDPSADDQMIIDMATIGYICWGSKKDCKLKCSPLQKAFNLLISLNCT